MKKLFLIGLIVLNLTGCSVIMSGAKRTERPQISYINEGVSKNMVENELGQPVQWITNGNETYTGIYKYTFDSGAKGRMAMHTILDLFTFGLWEIPGTIWELSEKGETYNFTVLYDSNMNVIKIS